MIRLQEMTPADYNTFMLAEIPKFAQSKMKGEGLSADEAMKVAVAIHKDFLPQGKSTPEHYFFNVMNDEEHVGTLWVNITQDKGEYSAFVCDIEIFEKYQGLGYGEKTMTLMEEFALKHGAQSIRLHVFGYNKVAQNLYTKLGFETTNINMKKTLVKK